MVLNKAWPLPTPETHTRWEAAGTTLCVAEQLILLLFSSTFLCVRVIENIPAIRSSPFIKHTKVGKEKQNYVILIILANLGDI